MHAHHHAQKKHRAFHDLHSVDRGALPDKKDRERDDGELGASQVAAS